ncbi:hypothetical protein [Legionella jamestowniensis]|uniref:Uncharacterized protein n=1 Tax=Legionella jamestowniensis TaxID=455 RepID=A0A0W0UZK3_9GAMM|nr:hypothetical protein [Legionella jamestowniensis]KTD13288.1 hypothetical protein Ljam_0078 [Legionella jamestowniensis]SFL77612.1 hypothetical protein SAMN02746073_1850 [Legionella jamestowniensis DSM 19215]
MKIVHLTNPQTVNACTLISIGVIKAILTAQNESAMPVEIIRTQDWAQNEYKKRFSVWDDGEGLLETTVYQQYFSDSFQLPDSIEVFVPISALEVRHLLANRNNYFEEGILNEEFYAFNFDAIGAIRRKIPEVSIDWSTITEEELLKLLPKDNQPSLYEQFEELVNRLNAPQGITIRMEGHTISLVKRKNTYYSYDSLTGDLSSTTNPKEIVAYLAQKLHTNGVKGCQVYFFNPQLTFTAQVSEYSIPTESIVEKLKPVTVQQIKGLITNRSSFDETEDGLANWQQANGELIELILRHKPKLFTIEWASVTAEQLITHLNLQQEMIIEVEEEIPSKIDFEENHVKLLNIIERLKMNIANQANDRKTNTYSQWKTNLLNQIQEKLDKEDQLTPHIQQRYIEAIRNVCAQRRNVVHFWSQPHSVAEFEELLQEKNLDTSLAEICLL